jgi:hypothetical protein
LPETTLSRAIIIAMKRKRPNERVQDFDHTDSENLEQLRQQIFRWATDNVESLATATPEIPEHFHNRVRANWKLLLAIAERVNWKAKALMAAVALEEVHANFGSATGIELLADIKIIFDARELLKDKDEFWDRVKSEVLIEELIKDKDKKWATYNNGKAVSQRQVAGLLKEFEIRPRTVRFEDGTAKGYELAWFSDDFERYLSPENPISIRHSVTSEENQRLGEENDPSQTHHCDGTEMGPNPLKLNTCDGVTDRNPHFGGNGEGSDVRPVPGRGGRHGAATRNQRRGSVVARGVRAVLPRGEVAMTKLKHQVPVHSVGIYRIMSRPTFLNC